jgi:thiol-disulfide isomerase/thioredoxin
MINTCYPWIILLVLLFGVTFILSNKNQQNTPINKKMNQKNESILYFFRANWCGYCREFKPHWNRLQELVKSDPTLNHIRLDDIDVDSPKGKMMIKQFKVNSFPTIILHNVITNRIAKFDGNRDCASRENCELLDFLSKPA